MPNSQLSLNRATGRLFLNVSMKTQGRNDYDTLRQKSSVLKCNDWYSEKKMIPRSIYLGNSLGTLSHLETYSNKVMKYLFHGVSFHPIFHETQFGNHCFIHWRQWKFSCHSFLFEFFLLHCHFLTEMLVQSNSGVPSNIKKHDVQEWHYCFYKARPLEFII